MTERLEGQKQRQALTAAERAIRALGQSKGDEARRAAERAVGLDQIGLYDGFDVAVGRAADELASGGSITEPSWQAIGELVGPGPLEALIGEVRSGG